MSQEKPLDELPEAQEHDDGGFEELDLLEVEEKINKKFEETGPSKPYLEKNTTAKIIDAVLKRKATPRLDSRNREYYETILTVTARLEDGRETIDNYGGLREYDDGYWNGQRSAFGKLRKMMEDEFGVETYAQMLDKLIGSTVKLKSEKTEYNDKEYTKNVIKVFLD